MFNCVNEEAFFSWYSSVCASKKINRSAVLNDLYQGYCETKQSVFTLPASRTVSGKDESYPYRIDDIGKCGASTVFIYF